jgi:hypothetical protein
LQFLSTIGSKDVIIFFPDSWLSEEVLWETEQDRASIANLEPNERSRRVLEEIQASIEQIKSSFELLIYSESEE